MRRVLTWQINAFALVCDDFSVRKADYAARNIIYDVRLPVVNRKVTRNAPLGRNRLTERLESVAPERENAVTSIRVIVSVHAENRMHFIAAKREKHRIRNPRNLAYAKFFAVVIVFVYTALFRRGSHVNFHNYLLAAAGPAVPILLYRIFSK